MTTEPTTGLFDIEHKAAPARDSRKYADYLAHALTDPLIVWPSPWAEHISSSSLQWARDIVPLQRLALLIKREYEQAADVEVMLYMYPRTMASPLDHDWTQVYLYCSTQALQFAGRDVPDEIKVEELTDWQADHLRHLKQWIYRKRVASNRLPKQRGKVADVEQPGTLEIEEQGEFCFD